MEIEVRTQRAPVGRRDWRVFICGECYEVLREAQDIFLKSCLRGINSNTIYALSMSEPNKPEKERTSIALSPDLLAAGKRQAEADRRSFSNYLEILIQRDVDGENPEPKLEAEVTE